MVASPPTSVIDAWIESTLVPRFAQCSDVYFVTRACEEAKAIVTAGAVIPPTWETFCAMARIWFSGPGRNDEIAREQCCLLHAALGDESAAVRPGTTGYVLFKWLERKGLTPAGAAPLLGMNVGRLFDFIHGRQPFPLDLIHQWAVPLTLTATDRLEMLSAATGSSSQEFATTP